MSTRKHLYWLGKKMSEETKRKMSLSNRGYQSLESRKKISITRLKKKAKLGYINSPETRKKMSISAMGSKKNLGKHWKIKDTTRMKGHFFSIDVRKRMADAHRGKKCNWWKGGATSKNMLLRSSFEYKIWRKAVFERDNYTCIWGGKEHGNKLHADHIKPFAHYPELRFAIDNGRTLCVDCHKTTNSYLKN